MSDIETVIGSRWIVEKLIAVPSITTYLGGARVYDTIIPRDASLPAIVISMRATRDIQTMPSKIVMSEIDYLVKVVAEATSYLSMSPIVSAASAALHKQRGHTTGGWILACTRVGASVMYEEEYGGSSARHLGIIVRLLVQGE